jgi:hypothetical protein
MWMEIGSGVAKTGMVVSRSVPNGLFPLVSGEWNRSGAVSAPSR